MRKTSGLLSLSVISFIVTGSLVGVVNGYQVNGGGYMGAGYAPMSTMSQSFATDDSEQSNDSENESSQVDDSSGSDNLAGMDCSNSLGSSVGDHSIDDCVVSIGNEKHVGDLTINGTYYVYGNLDVTGNLDVKGKLKVTGKLSVVGDINNEGRIYSFGKKDHIGEQTGKGVKLNSVFKVVDPFLKAELTQDDQDSLVKDIIQPLMDENQSLMVELKKAISDKDAKGVEGIKGKIADNWKSLYETLKSYVQPGDEKLYDAVVAKQLSDVTNKLAGVKILGSVKTDIKEEKKQQSVDNTKTSEGNGDVKKSGMSDANKELIKKVIIKKLGSLPEDKQITIYKLLIAKIDQILSGNISKAKSNLLLGIKEVVSDLLDEIEGQNNVGSEIDGILNSGDSSVDTGSSQSSSGSVDQTTSTNVQ